MKRKKVVLFLLVLSILLIGVYLQIGRKPFINHAFTDSATGNYELSVSITANKLFIANEKAVANHFVEKLLCNDFQNLQLSYDLNGYPARISLTVYTNTFTKFLKLPAFSLQYDVDSAEGELFFTLR